MTVVDTKPRNTAATASAPRRRRDLSRWLLLAVLAALAVMMLLPFGIVVINAFKTPEEYATDGPLGLPHSLYTGGLSTFWDRVDFGHVLLNSLLISATVAVAAVVLSILNAYALGIGRVRGRAWIVAAFLIANTVPQEGLIYPLYYAAKALNLYDSPWAVIIAFGVIQSAFGTYLFTSVLSSFPRELVEAAEIDGAGRWATLWRVVVPISRPTLLVLFVFFFIWTWNELFIPMVMLVSSANQTVPVALAVVQGEKTMDATMTSASALLGLLPAVAFFLIFQRTLSRGLTVGALK
ncbi:ABC transporter permease subunit [Nocardia sp. ET3-3]|uniref:ABC transporter permease subunit n=1 Tax=Nocardia terrae TaxID=2675851 RepID=A0A7K1UUQ9_9NOCA|nr:carbohydrate ABC transporter permease [Nocardia terrae]MVU78093.1 ABC transporter permease subunit [Nocardia terrae]